MKDAKLNAVLLLAKNYFRLSEIKVNVFADTIEKLQSRKRQGEYNG